MSFLCLFGCICLIFFSSADSVILTCALDGLYGQVCGKFDKMHNLRYAGNFSISTCSYSCGKVKTALDQAVLWEMLLAGAPDLYTRSEDFFMLSVCDDNTRHIHVHNPIVSSRTSSALSLGAPALSPRLLPDTS